MAVPSELSINAIVSYMLENGGKVTNHDLVKHFKRFLTDPETRVQARNDFKEYVNAVATIKNEGEKCLVLKRKYRQHAVSGFPSVPVSPVSDFEPMTPTSPTNSLLPHFGVGPPSSPLTYPSFSGSEESLGAVSPSRLPPPYRPPPDPNSSSPRSPNNLRNEAMSGVVESTYLGDQGGGGGVVGKREKASDGVDTPEGIESEQKVSVKEQMQKFNRLASENELSRALQHSSVARKRGEK
ncbi:unnamed protein product, partial [Timema podura]|nr:unnamed protein product [Timema podura]